MHHLGTVALSGAVMDPGVAEWFERAVFDERIY